MTPGIVLLQGPKRGLFLMSEAPLYVSTEQWFSGVGSATDSALEVAITSSEEGSYSKLLDLRITQL